MAFPVVSLRENAPSYRLFAAIGRKNWLFAGAKAGGERVAAIYTVIETAKLKGVEPSYISPTSSRRSQPAGPHPDGTISCRGKWQPEQQQIAQAA